MSTRTTTKALMALGSWFATTAQAAECERPTTLRDLSDTIEAYSDYGARVDFRQDDLKLRALAVEQALECLGEMLSPPDVARVHRFYALRYYLDRPPELDGALDGWDQLHLQQFGNILDAACKASGGPQGLDSPAWEDTNVDNVIRRHTCSAVATPVIPRAAKTVILVDGQLPATVLAPGHAPSTTLLPSIVQEVDSAGTVLFTQHVSTGAKWPEYHLRARQAEPLLLIATGTAFVAAGITSAALSAPARDNFCTWRFRGSDATITTCETTTHGDTHAADAFLYGGLGGVALGAGLIAGGSVWLHTEPNGAMVGITRPLK